VSYGLSDGSSQVHFKAGVTDVVKGESTIWVFRHVSPSGSELTREDSRPRQYLVSSWRRGRFEDWPALDVPEAETPVAFAISGDAPVVLLQRRDADPSKDRLDRRLSHVLSNDGSGWNAAEPSEALSNEFVGALHWGDPWLASLAHSLAGVCSAWTSQPAPRIGSKSAVAERFATVRSTPGAMR
jgi:hypothetical protein